MSFAVLNASQPAKCPPTHINDPPFRRTCSAWDLFEETGQKVIVLPKDETSVRFVWGDPATAATPNTVVVTSTTTAPTSSAAPTTVSPTQAPTAAPTDPVQVMLDLGSMMDFGSRHQRSAPADDATAPGPLFTVMSGTNRTADGRVDSGAASASGDLAVDVSAFLKKNGSATGMDFFCSEHPGLAVTVWLAAIDKGGPETSFEQTPDEDATESSSGTVIGVAVGMMLVAVLLGIAIRRKLAGGSVTGRKRMASNKTKKSATDEITHRKLEWQKKEAKSEPHRLLEILRSFREEQRALQEEEQARRRSKSAACGGPGALTPSPKNTGSTTAAGWQWLSVERIQQKVQDWIMSPPKAAPTTPRVESRLPAVGDVAASSPHFPQSEILAAWQDPMIAKPKARRSSSRRSSLTGAAKHIDVEPDEPEYAVVPPWTPPNADSIYATIEGPTSPRIETMESKALSVETKEFKALSPAGRRARIPTPEETEATARNDAGSPVPAVLLTSTSAPPHRGGPSSVQDGVYLDPKTLRDKEGEYVNPMFLRNDSEQADGETFMNPAAARNSVLVSPTRYPVGDWPPQTAMGLTDTRIFPITTTLGRPLRVRTVEPGTIIGISTFDEANRSPVLPTATFDYNNDALAADDNRAATDCLLIVACARLDREPASYDKTALAFAKGDHIHVVHKHANGLWEGAVVQSDGYTSAIGYFPFTIVDVLGQNQFTAADRRLQARFSEGRLSATDPTVERNRNNEPHRPSPIMLSGKGEWPFVSSTRANPLFDAAETAAACAEALDASSNRRLSTSSNSSFTPIREYE